MSNTACRSGLKASVAIGAAVHACTASSGQPVGEPAIDKSIYHLFNPTPRGLLRDLGTDRPDMTESPYTVDAGRFQIELSFADFTYDRENAESQTVRGLSAAPMLLKVGLLNNVDLQLGLDPYTAEKTTDRLTDTSMTIDGFGDTVVRVKVNLWGNDAGETAFALMPFVKYPTAEGGLGNDEVEWGVIAPLAISLPEGFSLGLMVEIDINRSAKNDRDVVDIVHTATVSRSLYEELGGFVEYAGFAGIDNDDVYRGCFNTGLTYGVTSDVQLDGGIRVGVTDAAEDFGLFAGLSVRF
ncbi:MAG: transporter [Phycisphaerales bacterium]|nr:transporter [Phycisphaerales bacterium]